MKTGLQITMLIYFGEVFEVFGRFWEGFSGDQLPVGCTMALPEKSRLLWEPGPFPSFVAAVINRSTVHRRGPKKKTLK